MSSTLVELRKQLRAEELKLLDLHKASEVAQAARATKSTTTAKKFTSYELAEFQRVFDEIDTDMSGSLTVAELSELASRLGVEMTQDQLKKQTEVLDTNHDGVLSFNEFVGWWAAERVDGGPSMAQMFMLKTRMKAEIVRRSLQNSLAITPDASEAMTQISTTISIGNGGSSSSKSASSFGLTVLPIDPETFFAAMKNKEGNVENHYGAVEIKLSVRPGATLQELQNIIPSFQANFGIIFEKLALGSDFEVKLSDDSKFILIKLLLQRNNKTKKKKGQAKEKKVPAKGTKGQAKKKKGQAKEKKSQIEEKKGPAKKKKKKTVFKNFVKGASRGDGDRTISLSDVMSTANLTVEFDRDISGSFAWVEGEECGSAGGTLCDILKGITASASIGCHRSTVTALTPEPNIPQLVLKQGFVAGNLLGQNAQSLEFVTKLSSPEDMKKVFLRLIEKFPIGESPEEEASATEVRKCFYNTICARYDCMLSLTIPEILVTFFRRDLFDTSKIPPPTSEELLQWINWARPDGDRAHWKQPDVKPLQPPTSADKAGAQKQKDDENGNEDDEEESSSSSEDEEEAYTSPKHALYNSIITMLGSVDGIKEVSILRKQANLRITCNNLSILQLLHLPHDDAARGVMLRKAFIGLHRKVGAAMQIRDFSGITIEEALEDTGVIDVLQGIMESFSPLSLNMLAPPKKVAAFKLPPIDQSDLDWNQTSPSI